MAAPAPRHSTPAPRRSGVQLPPTLDTRPSAPSIYFEIGGANELAPLLDLALRERGELLGVGGDDLEPGVEQAVFHVLLRQHLDRLRVQAGNNRARSIGGR